MIIYQYRILVFDCFDYEKVEFQIVYIYKYIRTSKMDPFKIDCINVLQVLIRYLIRFIDSCQWEIDFSQDLFERCDV